MNMRIILYILLSIFVAGNVLTEWRNRKTLPWMSNPMSAYLAGVPWAWIQDIGFLSLTAALVLFAIETPLIQVLFLIGAIALLMVVLTKYIPKISKVHKISAAIAFTSVIAGVLWRTRHTLELASGAAFSAVCVAFLFMCFAPKKTAIQERAVIACILVALYALVPN